MKSTSKENRIQIEKEKEEALIKLQEMYDKSIDEAGEIQDERAETLILKNARESYDLAKNAIESIAALPSNTQNYQKQVEIDKALLKLQEMYDKRVDEAGEVQDESAETLILKNARESYDLARNSIESIGKLALSPSKKILTLTSSERMDNSSVSKLGGPT